jgi:hypothetical protein
MKTTPSACDQCKFIGWDVGEVTQKGDTKKEPASAPPPQKNSISQLELEAIHWSEKHIKRIQDCNDDDCDCGSDDDIDWDPVTDKDGKPVTRTIPISATWEETVQGPSGPVTYKYTSSGTVVIHKKRGTSECFPSKIVGRVSRLYMPEYEVVVVSEGAASVSPEVGSAAMGALRKSASSRAKPTASSKRGGRRRPQS